MEENRATIGTLGLTPAHIKEATLLTLEVVSEHSPAGIRNLEKTALRASIWAIFEYGFSMVLRVVSSLVLTRLLLPAYFGELILVTTVIVGLNLLSDIGLAPSVIQSSRGDDPAFLNTAWTIQIFRGVVLWLIAVALSWPTAVFYRDPRLTVLIPVVALSTLINSFNSTNLLTLSRHMGVRRLFAIDGSTAIVSLIVTIAWAEVRPSIWAIVAGQLISTLYRLCISHISFITPGIRNSFGWDKGSVHHLVHFGKWVMIGTALTFCASQADRLILGRMISFTLLGIYGLAYQLSDIPRAIISALGSRVAYPFIAKLIKQPLDEFHEKYLHYRSYALLAGALLLAIMANCGGLLILHLYNARFHQAAWMVPILTLGLWQTLLYQTTWPVLYSFGKAKYNVYGNAAYCVVIFAGLPIAFHLFGLLGAVIAVAFADLPQYFAIQIGLARQGFPPWRQDMQMTAGFVTVVSTIYLILRLSHVKLV
jgi:O-antigen/teichoic acid export membrane protein